MISPLSGQAKNTRGWQKMPLALPKSCQTGRERSTATLAPYERRCWHSRRQCQGFFQLEQMLLSTGRRKGRAGGHTPAPLLLSRAIHKTGPSRSGKDTQLRARVKLPLWATASGGGSGDEAGRGTAMRRRPPRPSESCPASIRSTALLCGTLNVAAPPNRGTNTRQHCPDPGTDPKTRHNPQPAAPPSPATTLNRAAHPAASTTRRQPPC